MILVTGAELRAEREAAGIRAVDVAAIFERDPAAITRLEAAEAVPQTMARRYRRAIAALVEQRRSAARSLIRQLQEVAG